MGHIRVNRLYTFVLCITIPVFSGIAYGCHNESPRSETRTENPRQANKDENAAVYAKRTYFYVGGRYQNATQLESSTDQIMTGQIYVESLEPQQITKKWPIVMIPGAGQIGANFLNTPDGRPGWADYFLSQGYKLYLVDQVARGRSAWLPRTDPSQNLTIFGTDHMEAYFTAPEKFQLWSQARYHTQWSGTIGVKGDPVFDALYMAQVQYLSNYTYVETQMRAAGLELLEKTGPAVLLTHSQSGSMGWVIADAAQPHGLVKGIVALEPIGPPFVDAIPARNAGITRPYGITITPLKYNPHITSGIELKTVNLNQSSISNETLSNCTIQDPNQSGGPRQLTNLQGFPILLVTAEASYHQVYDYCTAEYLKQAGVDVTWLNLPSVGIHGNGHFMFMEKNSDVIAEAVESWLSGSIEP